MTDIGGSTQNESPGGGLLTLKFDHLSIASVYGEMDLSLVAKTTRPSSLTIIFYNLLKDLISSEGYNFYTILND